MRPRTRFAIWALASLLGAPRAHAAEAAPVVDTVALQDGRVLHHVRLMSDEGASVVVHADEGLLKLAKALLPRGFVPPPPPPAPESVHGPEMVMEPFDPNLKPEPPAPKPPKKVVAPRAGPAERPPVSPVFKGCTIVSFQMKAYRDAVGCAEVVIRNDGEQAVTLFPHDIVCLTADGMRHGGRIIVTDGIPPIIKHHELVPARGQVDDLITFTNEPLQVLTVQWAR